MTACEEAISALYDYDDIVSIRGRIISLERDYRALGQCDDLAVDALGDETPTDCIAEITEALASLRHHLLAAEVARERARSAAGRLIERGT